MIGMVMIALAALFCLYLDIQNITMGETWLMSSAFLTRACRQAAFALGLALMLPATPTLAGGGDYCEPPLALDLTDRPCGGFHQPFLSPANDSRVNLLLLARDQRRLPLLPSQWEGDTLPVISFYDFDPSYEELEKQDKQKLDRLRRVASQAGVQAPVVEETIKRLRGWRSGRCQYNGARAAADFVEALNAARPDYPALATVRLQQAGLCDDGLRLTFFDDDLASLSREHQVATVDFQRYLIASGHFYKGEFDTAKERFSALLDSQVPWVAETASYMLGRVSLNQAQEAAVSGWIFEPGKVNHAELRHTERFFQDYLEHYPEGRYVDSARGLFRRIHWLRGEQARLGQLYAQLINEVAGDDLPQLAAEVDLRYLESARPLASLASPQLTLARQLQMMRAYAPGRETLTSQVLSNTYTGFGKDGEPWATLAKLAGLLYVDNDYEAVLKATGTASSGPLDIADFTTQMYRGLALQRLQHWPEAEKHWRQLAELTQDPIQRQAIFLGLAQSLENNQQLSALFAAESPAQSGIFRLPILVHVAPPEVLEYIIVHGADDNERQHALLRLLRTRLARGQYQEYLDERALAKRLPFTGSPLSMLLQAPPEPSDSYQCPTVPALAQALSDTPEQTHLLNCLGQVLAATIHVHGDIRRVPGAPGGGPDQFPGDARSALDLFRTVINSDSATQDERAYALFRAINCYNRGRNRCGGEPVEQSERQQWFSQLKNQHTDSPWARQQKYYW